MICYLVKGVHTEFASEIIEQFSSAKLRWNDMFHLFSNLSIKYD